MNISQSVITLKKYFWKTARVCCLKVPEGLGSPKCSWNQFSDGLCCLRCHRKESNSRSRPLESEGTATNVADFGLWVSVRSLHNETNTIHTHTRTHIYTHTHLSVFGNKLAHIMVRPGKPADQKLGQGLYVTVLREVEYCAQIHHSVIP